MLGTSNHYQATSLGIQTVTGIILAMHYKRNRDLAFISVEHILRNVNYGWMIPTFTLL
jgi:ubiquinol-cytochrome c reductase cytochrome b subunit